MQGTEIFKIHSCVQSQVITNNNLS